MRNSFAALNNNAFTRKWGGTVTDTVDPYISGYFFTHWSYLPQYLGLSVSNAGGPDQISNTRDCGQILQASCLSVTIPGATVNKAEFTGLGGVKWAAPTNVEMDNTVTMKFLEFGALPILAIMHGWVRLIRDYRTGVTQVMTNGPDDYTKSNYSGAMYYWTT